MSSSPHTFDCIPLQLNSSRWDQAYLNCGQEFPPMIIKHPVLHPVSTSSFHDESHIIMSNWSIGNSCSPRWWYNGEVVKSKKNLIPKLLLSWRYLSKWTKASKCHLPGFLMNFANLLTAKIMSVRFCDRYINDPIYGA